MNLLPYKKYVLNSELLVKAIYARFHENVQVKYLIDSKKINTSFQGGIIENGFRVEKEIEHRNSFKPEAIVKPEQTSRGTLVSVTLRMTMFVNVFMAGWISMVLFAFFIILFDNISKGEYSGFTFAPLGMGVFAYVIAIGGFNSETDELEDFIKRLVTNKLIEN
jgi:hypothetical protein